MTCSWVISRWSIACSADVSSVWSCCRASAVVLVIEAIVLACWEVTVSSAAAACACVCSRSWATLDAIAWERSATAAAIWSTVPDAAAW